MIIAVTGHRPNKLWGYNLNHPNYKKLSQIFYNYLLYNYKIDNKLHCLSGMALGVDTVFALTVLNFKKQYSDVTLECAIPCLNHSCRWNEYDKRQYDNILKSADKVTLVSNQKYQPYLMQIRNSYMVDKCDKLLAVWDRTKGGTANCVNYAKSTNKHIDIINLSKFS